jgi:hypothetical protein
MVAKLNLRHILKRRIIFVRHLGALSFKLGKSAEKTLQTLVSHKIKEYKKTEFSADFTALDKFTEKALEKTFRKSKKLGVFHFYSCLCFLANNFIG